MNFKRASHTTGQSFGYVNSRACKFQIVKVFGLVIINARVLKKGLWIPVEGNETQKRVVSGCIVGSRSNIGQFGYDEASLIQPFQISRI